MDAPTTYAPLLPGLDETSLGSELLESSEIQQARYTGKIVEKNRDRVEQILATRAMGISVRQVCAAFNVSPHTLTELERRHRVKLATLKDRLARKFGVFVELGIDRAIAEVDKMDRNKLLISLGIAADKMQLLSDAPTVIVGQQGDGPRRFTVDSLQARLGSMRNVTGTGSDGGENDPTGAALGPAAGAAIEAEADQVDDQDTAGSDNQSPESNT